MKLFRKRHPAERIIGALTPRQQDRLAELIEERYLSPDPPRNAVN